MVQLRPYQIRLIAEIRKGLAKHKHILAVAATGAGKTKTFIAIAADATLKGTTCLILTESTKIFKQTAAELNAIQIYAGTQLTYIEPGRLHIAMAQTLARRTNLIFQLAALGSRLLTIIDEAHIGTPTKTIKAMPDCYRIGFTATPDFKVAPHLPELYKGIVIGPQPQELVEQGFLSPYYHKERRAADLSTLAKKGGEYTEQSQFAAFEKPQVFAGLHEDLKNTPYKKCLIFCSSIKHCNNLAIELRSQNYIVAEVHSENPQSNAELAMFMHGTIDICVSVGILTKGFDMPQIDLIILQRATTSLALYCQMVGRGSRIYPGKLRFTVLDYGGNATRHGLWNFEHDWEEKWNPKKKKKKGEGVAPVKECPKCNLLVSVNIMICPECEHVWERKEPEFVAGEMVDVTAEYDKLRGRQIASLSPPELAAYAKVTNKKAFAIRVAKSLFQSGQNDYLVNFADAMDYKAGWTGFQTAGIGEDKIEFHNIIIR